MLLNKVLRFAARALRFASILLRCLSSCSLGLLGTNRTVFFSYAFGTLLLILAALEVAVAEVLVSAGVFFRFQMPPRIC